MKALPAKQAIPLQGGAQNELDIINALPDAILGIDRHGIINFLNHSAEELLGLNASEIIGHPLRNLLYEGFDEILNNSIRKLLDKNDASPGFNARIELIIKRGNADKLRADVLLRATNFSGSSILLSMRHITPLDINKDLLLLLRSCFKL
jgi:PAS domain S-box-containing protein